MIVYSVYNNETIFMVLFKLKVLFRQFTLFSTWAKAIDSALKNREPGAAVASSAGDIAEVSSKKRCRSRF